MFKQIMDGWCTQLLACCDAMSTDSVVLLDNVPGTSLLIPLSLLTFCRGCSLLCLFLLFSCHNWQLWVAPNVSGQLWFRKRGPERTFFNIDCLMKTCSVKL